MLPVGKYMAKAIQAELGFADTGTELVAVQFEVTEGEHKGARVTWRGYFAEKTAKRAVESLRHCGWSGDWDTWEGLGSQVVQLDVQEDRDMKTGEVRGTRVAWVNAARVPMKNAMDQSQRTSFTSRMRGIVAEVLGPQAAPTRSAAPGSAARPSTPRSPGRPPAPMYEEQHGEDPVDDIPFVSRGAW